MDSTSDRQISADEAYVAGRAVGFGVSALVLSLVTVVNLFSAEKAILAIVLGVLAVRGAGSTAPLARGLGTAAITIGILFLATVVLVLATFWGDVVHLIELLKDLG